MKKLIKIFTLLCFLISLLQSASAQNHGSENITIHETEPITTDPPFTLVESFLAINPTNPDNLLASAMSTTADHSVVYATWNGGSTWEKVKNGNEGVFPGADPMLTFDGNGRAYFATITSSTTVWRSSDNGRSWSDPVKVKGSQNSHDRQWIAVSPKPDDSTLPVYGTAKTNEDINGKDQHVLITTRSIDGAQSFSEPNIIPAESGGHIHAPSDLVVRKNGTVLLPYLIYHGYQDRSRGVATGERLLLISDDDGETWSGPHQIGEKLTYGNAAGDESLTSKGLESPPLVVDETGGEFDGSAYTAWTTIIDGHLQVVVSHSRDEGQTWSEPVHVNSGGFDSNHSAPMIAINDKGIIAVTWNDRRNDPEDNCFQHYVAISRDGGKTFSTDRKIAPSETCPPQGRWTNGGETQGLVALPNGDFRVTWPVGEKDGLTLWTAIINIKQNID